VVGLVLLSAQAQQRNPPAGSAQGTLTVTFRIVTSVGVVLGPDGEPRIVVANAVDPRDNVSGLEPVVMASSSPLQRIQSVFLLFLCRYVFCSGVQVDIANVGGGRRENHGPRDFLSFMLDRDGVGPCGQVAKDIRTAGPGLHFL
jgi:hypothetical protein